MLLEPEEAVSWERKLAQSCRLLGIKLNEKQVRSFRVYRDHLLDWNPRAKLISSKDEIRILNRHFVDSLSLLKVMDVLPGMKVLDVGSGGGFPGLPLKICRPKICVTLLEPKEKRYYFLKSLVRRLGLKGVNLCRRQAQEARRDQDLEERFDLVLARAVSATSRTMNLCFPFVRPGGLFVSYRGQCIGGQADQIAEQAKRAGAEMVGMVRVKIPEEGHARYLLIACKKHG